MASRRNALLDQFFNALISGQRSAARDVVDELFEADCLPERVITHLLWPTLEQIQTLHRNDQLNNLSYQYASRLMQQLLAHVQLRLDKGEQRDSTVLLVCGDEQSEEIAGQMACDLLEADGYTVYFTGGGVANDEIVEQIGQLQCDRLVVFGAMPQTVPYTRLLIDRLHEIGMCPNLQIVVGGGVFNRAEGLAEEIGADLWAKDPGDLVEQMRENTQQRMTEEQRTVGRRRKSSGRNAAAA